MSITGSWKLTLNTPMGEQNVVLEAVEQGATFSGTMSSQGEQLEILQGTIEGARVRWQADAKKPMPMKLNFDVTIDGDSMSGTFRPGMFPGSPVTGSRI